MIFNQDGLAKSLKTSFPVIPAEAGIQEYQGLLDPGFRRGDGLEGFLRTHHLSLVTCHFPVTINAFQQPVKGL